MNNPPPLSSPPPPTQPKRRGCFFYGCLTCVILFLLLGIGVALIVHHGINQLNTWIAEHTDTNAMALPKVEMSPDEIKKLNERVDAFNDALKAHSNAPPLVLTGRDINALLAGNTNANVWSKSFYVTLEGDQVKGQMSLPLGDFFRFPFVHTQGRYLNGSGSLKGMLTNGTLFVNIQNLEVKGNPVPEKAMEQLRQANIAANFNTSNNAAILERYESIEVTNSSIVIKAKQH